MSNLKHKDVCVKNLTSNNISHEYNFIMRQTSTYKFI